MISRHGGPKNDGATDDYVSYVTAGGSTVHVPGQPVAPHSSCKLWSCTCVYIQVQWTYPYLPSYSPKLSLSRNQPADLGPSIAAPRLWSWMSLQLALPSYCLGLEQPPVCPSHKHLPLPLVLPSFQRSFPTRWASVSMGIATISHNHNTHLW